MKLSYRNEANARATAAALGRPLEQAKCFSVKAAASDENEILLYDYIGFPFNDAGELVKTISDMRGKRITVRINSPGGDIFDAVSVFNALSAHDAKVTTRAEALAASAASIILMAGKEVQAYESAMIMLHEPWVLIAGNRFDMIEMADLLEKISGIMVDIYWKHSTVTKKELQDMLKNETWMTAAEAKKKGFVNTVLEGKTTAKASFDMSIFGKGPAASFEEVADQASLVLSLMQLKQAFDPYTKTN
ncbi:MAG: Clp protease ClpP [Desulfobacteraceae bacterium]|nr:MAG: Clp protease ClpP [Desulfobacteraceae bacterium]